MVLRISKLIYGSVLAALASGALAASPAGEAEQRLRQDVQVLLSQLAASGAFGEHPERISLHLDQPAQRVVNLGVLVDSANPGRARDGLVVLGTTPGSIAERLGLRPGDVIVGVNGTSLRRLGADAEGHALAASTLKSTVEAMADDESLDVDVMRGGDLVPLNATVRSVYLPALRMELGAAALAGADSSNAAATPGGTGCGRISTWDVAPPSEHKYHANVILIDGVSPGPSGGETWRVNAGTHRLLIGEDIPVRQFGVGEFASLRRDTHKELVVTIKPNTTARIASQLHLDKASDITKGGYWDPVVWREVAEDCP